MKTKHNAVIAASLAAVALYLYTHKPCCAPVAEPKPAAAVQFYTARPPLEDTGTLAYREAQRQREFAARWNR